MTELRRVSESRPPQWFPDGNRIAFGHRGSVYVVDSLGLNLQWVHGRDKGSAGDDINNLAYRPTVSPDGSRVAYAAYKNSGWFLWSTEGWEILTASPDGSNRRMLTNDETMNIYPVWSPNGSDIYFVSRPRVTSALLGVFVVTSDGSEARIVYPQETPALVVSGAPVLSPDGNRIAFLLEGIRNSTEIHVVETDGSGLTKLVEEETSEPDWILNGSRIGFATRETWDNMYPSGTAAGVYTIGIDGSNLQEVVSFPSREVAWTNSISWSPDGSAILFGPHVIEADGSEVRRLPGPGTHASWSPDSSRIAIYAGDDSNIVLYTLATDGSAGRILVEKAADGSLAAANGRPLW